MQIKQLIKDRRSDADRAIWASACGVPREHSQEELTYTAQCLDALHSTLIFAGCASLLGVTVLMFKNWPLSGIAILVWLSAIVCISAMMIVFGSIPDRSFRAKPAKSSRHMALGSILFGLLWGSAAKVFPHPFDAPVTLSCLLVGVIAFAGLPTAQIGFLLSFALAGTLLGVAPVPVSTIAAAATLSLIPIVLTARLRFRRSKLRQEHQKARLQRLMRRNNSWTWETDIKGRLKKASDPLFKLLGTSPTKVLNRPLFEIFTKEEGSGRQGRAGELGHWWDAFAYFLEAHLPFNDIVVTAEVRGKSHQWSLSAQPVYDALGRFAGFKGAGVDLTQSARAVDELVERAEIDPLTGVANRHSIFQKVRSALDRQQNGWAPTAVMLVDLDNFKKANDTFGHQLGDKVLKHVAERLKSFINGDGSVGRIGGDEFIVVLPSITKRIQLSSLASQLIECISSKYEIDGQSISIGASIGIAVAPENGATVEELVSSADLALYAVKDANGGHAHFFEPALRVEEEERRCMEIELRAAIKNDQISLQFQPFINADDEMLCGFEALIRWEHPEKGAITPDVFIPLAEAAGLMDLVGDWVLRNACTVAATWPKHVTLAVNVSPSQFENTKFVQMVGHSLEQSGLSAERLELEITEAVFLTGSGTIEETIQQLHDLGVKWTIDDFGTGYSGLGYLLKAPFSKIKIDRSFVNGVSVEDSQKSAIVKCIVALAQSLDMLTTAEGVETHRDLEAVKELGCSHVQGFVYGTALTATEALSLTKTRFRVAPQGHTATRREPRTNVLRSATIAHLGVAHNARIRNISTNGARIEVRSWPAETGARITVAIENDFDQKGTVRWVNGNSFGVEFDEPLHEYGAQPEIEMQNQQASAA